MVQVRVADWIESRIESENSSRARACQPGAIWPATAGWATTQCGGPRCCSASAASVTVHGRSTYVT